MLEALIDNKVELFPYSLVLSIVILVWCGCLQLTISNHLMGLLFAA